MRRLALCWVIALWGCTETPQDEARAVCDVLCSCTAAPLPSVQTQCSGQCVSQFANQPLPDTCTQCIFEHAKQCSALETDCTPFCQQSQPTGGNQ